MIARIEGFLGKTVDGKKSRIPAFQDRWQSITGLILACFMICHMIFTGTILCGKGAFNGVVKFAEPFGLWWITNLVAAVIFVAFVIHAFFAMRKFPANYKAYRAFKAHKVRIKHFDTTLWWFQFLTGFLLFFFASAHLITIICGDRVTADASIARFADLHLFYFVLLVFTVVHAAIGMYRLYVKWISIDGHSEEAKNFRKKVRNVIFAVWGFFFLVSVIADFKWISLG
ncbi:fumarate reductase cytochrome b subunit [uncultured Campylobacter sp.]|uniref:fumarate reductase cytochrome b subunit n=1 Tax=uncultured Campylobacter sp. TaxID=218934 RepID=UPI0026017E56|nr:fumarate reductase cytochrome b subunit [uncultured Campylobacter sp.]